MELKMKNQTKSTKRKSSIFSIYGSTLHYPKTANANSNTSGPKKGIQATEIFMGTFQFK